MQRNSLQLYYKNHFMMKLMYNFSIPEIENMMPWERDMYIDMINAEEKKKERA
jgi:hypothetical protein